MRFKEFIRIAEENVFYNFIFNTASGEFFVKFSDIFKI